MSPDTVTEFIQTLRDEADGADFRTLSASAVPSAAPGAMTRWRTRLATAVAAGVASVAALGGLAYAADDAAPGAFLYGIDRAFEVIGIGSGGDHERLEEAVALAAHGDDALGLEHAAGATGDPAAQAALIQAAERLMVREQNQVGEQTQTRLQVAELLQYMAQNAGDVDGPTVAGLARSIGGDPVGPPDEVPADPPDGTPVGPPDGTPVGPPDGTPVGPPDGTPVGPPDSTPGGSGDGTPGGPGDGTPGAGGDAPADSNGGQGAGDGPQGTGTGTQGGSH